MTRPQRRFIMPRRHALDRRNAAARFTLRQSVDDLLAVFDRPTPITPASVVRDLADLALLPSAWGWEPL